MVALAVAEAQQRAAQKAADAAAKAERDGDVVASAVHEVLGGKLRARMRTDCERCKRGFEQPDLLRRYSELGKKGSPETKECCFWLEHAYPLTTLADEVLRQKEASLLQQTSFNKRKLHEVVQGKALSLLQSECGIGLLGTPTATTNAARTGSDKRIHRVSLYVREPDGKLKSMGQSVNMIMGLRGPPPAPGAAAAQAAAATADGGSQVAAAAAPDGAQAAAAAAPDGA